MKNKKGQDVNVSIGLGTKFGFEYERGENIVIGFRINEQGETHLQVRKGEGYYWLPAQRVIEKGILLK